MRHVISVPAPCDSSFSYEAQQTALIVIHPLARRIFYCTLSASLTREIDSSVIGRYGGEVGREAEGAPGKEKRRRRKDERRETSSMKFIRAQVQAAGGERRAAPHATGPAGGEGRVSIAAELQPSFSHQRVDRLPQWRADVQVGAHASQDAQSSCSESTAKHQSLRQHNEAALGCGST